MTVRSIYLTSLILSALLLIIGFMLRVMHWPWGKSIFFSGHLLSIIYGLIGLFQMFNKEDKSLIEKFIWLLGFIFLTPITAIVFYYRVMRAKK